MPNVILYTLNESAPCRIVQMTLSVLNLKHEEVTVDLFSGEHKTPEYLEVSFPCNLFSFSWVVEFYSLDKKNKKKLLKTSQNKKGRKNFQLHHFLNTSSQLPAVKKYSKNGAAGKLFGPSCFDPAFLFTFFNTNNF